MSNYSTETLILPRPAYNILRHPSHCRKRIDHGDWRDLAADKSLPDQRFVSRSILQWNNVKNMSQRRESLIFVCFSIMSRNTCV